MIGCGSKTKILLSGFFQVTWGRQSLVMQIYEEKGNWGEDLGLRQQEKEHWSGGVVQLNGVT